MITKTISLVRLAAAFIFFVYATPGLLFVSLFNRDNSNNIGLAFADLILQIRKDVDDIN